MIKFNRKEFVLPALLGTAVRALGGKVMTGTMIAGTGISAYQGHKQGKELERQGAINQEAIEKQAELMKQQNKQLNKIAEKVKANPAAVGQVGDVLAAKSYSVTPLLKSIGNSAKIAFTKGAASNVAMASAGAGTAYLAGKYIQHDMKKNKLKVDPNLGIVSKNYSVPSSVLNGLKYGGKAIKKEMGLGTIAMGSVFGGLPLALGYMGDKAQAKSQINATKPQVQQKQYSAAILGKIANLGKSMKGGWATFKSHPMQTLTGFGSVMGSFGIGGTKNIQAFGSAMKSSGKKYGSNAAVKAGNWIQNHKTAANALSIIPGVGAAKVTFDAVDKAGNKIGETIDPNAYKYKKFKDQQTT